MLFDYELIIPPKTTADAPTESLARLTRGKITQIRVMFPPGPATLAHVVVRHNLHQLVPANFEGSLNFDDTVITSIMQYDLLDSPYELRMIGWSPLATYQHTITFQFNIEPITGDTWDNFNDMLFSLNEVHRR